MLAPTKIDAVPLIVAVGGGSTVIVSICPVTAAEQPAGEATCVMVNMVVETGAVVSVNIPVPSSTIIDELPPSSL